MIRPGVVKEGYVVSIGLVPGTAPHDCCIGLVKDANRQGIKINPAKWDDKSESIRLSREDFYIPWTDIDSMLVCTE